MHSHFVIGRKVRFYFEENKVLECVGYESTSFFNFLTNQPLLYLLKQTDSEGEWLNVSTHGFITELLMHCKVMIFQQWETIGCILHIFITIECGFCVLNTIANKYNI